MSQKSFEKFYFNYVATGEGCGCAERIIDVHEFNRRTDERCPSPRPRRGWLTTLLTRLRLRRTDRV